ncbi:MAG: hypothetical protein HYX72_11710 [Acidobacteria bacterium]|nr:hypothetical protein [Acidobacteriota bacterium]
MMIKVTNATAGMLPQQRPVLTVLLFLVALSIPARAQNIQFTRQFGSISNDGAGKVAVDATGVYVVGSTWGALPGQTFTGRVGPYTDAFVCKYDANGNVLWVRQFGSTVSDGATGVAVDATGIYVVGYTAGALPGQPTSAEGQGAFIRKYDPTGNHVWTRQFGAASFDFARAVAVDATGIYVVGSVSGALAGQTSAGGQDAFLRKYDANGSVVWDRQFGTSTYDGALDVATGPSVVYVVGHTYGALPGQTYAGRADGPFPDAFVRKYDTNGSELWTRQFGRSDSDELDAVAVDATGVYVAGTIAFSFLPGQIHMGDWDAFVRKYDTNGSELWTRQFGTSGSDWAMAVALDATGIHVAGTVSGALPGQTSVGQQDAFVRKYDGNGNEVWTRQFGTTGNDGAGGLALTAAGLYVAGSTAGIFPGESSAGGADAFLAKVYSPPPPPAVSDGGAVNNASFAPSPSPIAPGSIAAVFGTNLNDGSTVLFSSFGSDGKLVTTLGGATAKINNIPAPIFYSTPGQLGIQIPTELAGQTAATLQVTVAGQESASRTIVLDALAPGIFTLTQDGKGAVAALHQDGVTAVTAQNPARPDEIVVIFATGLGAIVPPLATGAAATGNRTVSAATVTIDGIPAEVQFSGAAPGFVGLNQINVRIPPNSRSGTNIPVALSIGGKQSNPATIAVSVAN